MIFSNLALWPHYGWPLMSHKREVLVYYDVTYSSILPACATWRKVDLWITSWILISSLLVLMAYRVSIFFKLFIHVSFCMCSNKCSQPKCRFHIFVKSDRQLFSHSSHGDRRLYFVDFSEHSQSVEPGMWDGIRYIKDITPCISCMGLWFTVLLTNP